MLNDFLLWYLQDVTITNDGATILKLLEVEHPAAKVLCELAELQDREVGDGTTSVVSSINSCCGEAESHWSLGNTLTWAVIMLKTIYLRTGRMSVLF